RAHSTTQPDRLPHSQNRLRHQAPCQRSTFVGERPANSESHQLLHVSIGPKLTLLAGAERPAYGPRRRVIRRFVREPKTTPQRLILLREFNFDVDERTLR